MPMATHEKPPECEFCEWETELLVWVDMAGQESGWLCNVCRSTRAGNAFCFPRQHEMIDALKAISHTTNMILGAIENRSRKGQD